MSTALAAPVLLGAQRPRVCSFPESDSSRGVEALEVAKRAGLIADPWQEFNVMNALGVRSDGTWAAFEVGTVVSRQNGKGGILEIRELAGLFAFEERLIVHSAHQFDTSLEAFRRLLWLIEDTPDFDRQVKRVSRSHGEEGIELKGGRRIRFRTRTKGGGRGFSCDCLMLDEAMILALSAHGALLPTLSARENPQVWYMGSAVDQEVHEDGVVFARVRERGIEGDPRLAFFEHSVEADSPAEVTDEMAEDPGLWAQANPALGIRISAEHIDNERRSMDPRTFAVERLGVGDWPPTSTDGQVISLASWNDLTDDASEPLDPVCFAFDVAPNRSSASISVSGRRSDGLFHVEVVDRKQGTGWLPPRLAELTRAHEAMGNPICDLAGPAATLLPELEQLGVRVDTVNAKEHAQACGLTVDLVEQRGLRHLGQPELAMAIKGAAQRPLGDAWAWARKASSVDISPLVSSTLALWGVRRTQSKVPMVAFK